jgi:hypothetical protein
MRQYFITSAGTATEWLFFFAVLLVLGLAVGGLIIWLTLFRKSGKRRRKNRNHRRRKNPTLAETGGLPPVRESKKPDAPTPPPDAT